MRKFSLDGKEEADGIKKESDQFKLLPPDGGYAWIVAFAHFLMLGTSIPVQVAFGLLYKDVFIELNFSPTEISVLLNINVGVGQGFALFNGPLIRRFGYRKMAILGTTLMTAGMMLTSVAVTIMQFIIAYGVIASLGFGMVLQTSQVAFNSYFKEKKSKAMGLAMTGVRLCMVLMPQLVVALLDTYGPRGACLVIAGVVMQGFVSVSFFQPIRYHMKKMLLDPEQLPLQSQGKINAEGKAVKGNEDDKLQTSVNLIDEKIDDFEEPLLKPNNDVTQQQKTASSAEGTEEQAKSSYTLYEDLPQADDKHTQQKNYQPSSKSSVKRSSKTETIDGGEKVLKKGIIGSFVSKIVTVLDLSLLTNVVFANIIVGMALATASETNFSLMTPLIFTSMGFSTNEAAALMSIMSVIDIVARFLIPLAAGRFKVNARIMYFVSIILLVISRSMLVLLSTFESVLILGICLGIAKGIRNVYILLVIPAYVPTERLASAIGLQMTISAMLFFCFGPIIGLAVEEGGDYDGCIHAINGLTLITIFMWAIELVAFRKKTN